jgi:hypothetical protein
MTDKIKRDVRDIGDFTKIELRGWGDITVTQGDICQLFVEAQTDVLDHLFVEVEGNTLVIAFDKQSHFHTWQPLMTEPIHYAITLPKLESVKIAGKGSLTAKTLTGDKLALLVPGVANFNIDSLEYNRVAFDVQGVTNSHIGQVNGEALALSIKGTGKINIGTIQADELAVSIKGSGTMTLAGQVKTQAISMPGVGNYDGEYLQTESTTISAEGMANATVWATESLAVTLRGMGNIRYYGTPDLIKQIRGVGRVKHLGASPTVKV